MSARDEQMRAHTHELVVHLGCGAIRGPLRSPSSGLERWQSCPCEDDPVVWDGGDVSRELELCVLCARGVAGGTSRWAWLGCLNCRAVNDRAARAIGFRPVPLGRHSLMNGIGVRGGAGHDDFERQQTALVDWSIRARSLDDWRDQEVRRLVVQQAWQTKDQVSLADWQARLPPSDAASVSALQRSTGLDPAASAEPRSRG